jgi:uncharacterized protein (TIGR03067 family)
MRPCCLAVLASSLLLCQGGPGSAPPSGGIGLEGEWAVLVWDFNGYWFTAHDGAIGDHYRDLRFTFTGDRVRITLREKGQTLGWWGWDWVNSPYKVNPTKDPKQIDIEQVGNGIYTFRDERLVLCLARGHSSKRPDRFELKPRAADTLILLERTKQRLERRGQE